MKELFSILIILLITLSLRAQGSDLSNWRIKTINIEKDTIIIDSLPIIPSSVKLYEVKTNNPLLGNFEIAYNQLIFNDLFYKQLQNQIINIHYRVFPFDFQKPVKHLDTMLIGNTYQGGYIGVDYGENDDNNRVTSLFNNRGLQYSGSFARGVSFGNSQNLVLNSQFNLQLSGKLSEDTEIVAALTDENIPLQAEGNTQQLQEFDKIFIRINRKNSSITAGDYEISSREQYFMKYYKKLQGATFSHTQSIKDKNEWKTEGSFAISRGQFSRNTLLAIEGNQGPYKLNGNNGEQFIIVLAGTERIYLDGQVLKRGIEEDYIIDYNQGELTFTNKHLITQNSRIIAEFEYLDQTFQRSLYTINSRFEAEKLQVYFGLFSQQDSKRALGDTELSEAELTTLQDIGDDLENAFTLAIDTLTDGFDINRVQYTLRDTAYTLFNPTSNQIDTIYTSILVFSKDPSIAAYIAQFSQVGQGNGNYHLLTTNDANGRVYQWIAPDELTGQAQGDFEPIKRLTAPQKQQLYTLGANLQLGQHSNLTTEIALSNQDLNRFSTLDNNDNLGTALFAHYQVSKELGKRVWHLQSDIKYEFVQQNFKALNPYRNAEFNRDWNIGFNNNQDATHEHIAKAAIQLQKKDNFQLEYEFSNFSRVGIYQGIKQDFNINYQQAGYDLRIYGSALTSESDLESSTFFRPRFDFSKSFKKLKNWKLGVYGEREKNALANKLTDTLKTTAFYWDLYKIYLQSPNNHPFKWQIDYVQQSNFLPNGTTFIKSSLATEVNLSGHWQTKRSNQLKWNFSYRDLAIEAVGLSNQKAQKTYLGRLDYSLNLWRGALRWNTNYEIGSGQEAKVEFQFLKVNKGEGLYVWEPTAEYDVNGDSIPQINEFVIAPFRDQANYIRINTFSNDFIRTNNVILNQSLRLRPSAIWRNASGIKKILSKFSTQSIFRINRKVKLDGSTSPWNPFELNIADTSLVTIASTVQNVLFFNKNHPVYDFQIGQSDNRNRNVLTTGFEQRQTKEQFFRSRWNLNSQFGTQINWIIGNRNTNSELFDNRDYDIDYYKLIPKLTYLINQQLETIFSYEYQQANNTLEVAKVKANFHNLKTTFTYNRTSKMVLKGDFSFINITLNEKISPNLELTLLDGLKAGKNFLWGLTLNRQLANNVQISLRYEGRKTGQNSIIHLGSAQVRATF